MSRLRGCFAISSKELEVQEHDIPLKTRPPSVSTVIYFPETVMPKAAKAGRTNSARLTSAVRSSIINHWKGCRMKRAPGRHWRLYTPVSCSDAWRTTEATPLGRLQIHWINREFSLKCGPVSREMQVHLKKIKGNKNTPTHQPMRFVEQVARGDRRDRI